MHLPDNLVCEIPYKKYKLLKGGMSEIRIPGFYLLLLLFALMSWNFLYRDRIFVIKLCEKIQR